MGDPKLHSEYSMSGFSRTIACPASIPLSKLAPVPEDNPAGIHGTNGHTCLEAFFKNQKHPYTVKSFLAKTFPKEMIDHAYEAYQEVMKIAARFPGASVHSEIKVDTSHFTEPGNFGTTDVAIVELFGTLVILDYKYGVMPVDPKENVQMIGYGLGMAKRYDYNFEYVELYILQPRGRTKEHWVRSWRTTMKNLRSWEKVFRNAVAETKKPNPKVNPGSHCFFCPSRTFNCPAHIERVTSRAQEDFVFDTEDMW